ncbi:AMP-binding protein [Amycolatopsis acidiphila]|uniref:AMP-binding protein n=1 Tax=Amycolatopsis acidiphila TaxID=715473 RepID=A0A558ACN3_9PSEU|nr:AMP-binding protein [Amycolatopsis acidiphila]
MQVGATGVLQGVWHPARFVELVAEHGITYTSAATPFLHDTLNAPNLAAPGVSTLERFCCMGAPIPRAIVREARRKLARARRARRVGAERERPGDPDDKLVDTDGYPWPGMRIRVVDAEGRVPAPGQEGRLQVREHPRRLRRERALREPEARRGRARRGARPRACRNARAPAWCSPPVRAGSPSPRSRSSSCPIGSPPAWTRPSARL